MWQIIACYWFTPTTILNVNGSLQLKSFIPESTGEWLPLVSVSDDACLCFKCKFVSHKSKNKFVFLSLILLFFCLIKLILPSKICLHEAV